MEGLGHVVTFNERLRMYCKGTQKEIHNLNAVMTVHPVERCRERGEIAKVEMTEDFFGSKGMEED